MELNEINRRSNTETDKKLNKVYNSFENLLNELKKKEAPKEIIDSLNRNIDEINTFSGNNKELRKHIKKLQYGILKLMEKELKIVPKNMFRNRWMAIGMAVFGVPFGVAFGASLDNMAFIGIGIPLGMTVGMAIGAGMDKKALSEGRQLDIEINY